MTTDRAGREQRYPRSSLTIWQSQARFRSILYRDEGPRRPGGVHGTTDRSESWPSTDCSASAAFCDALSDGCPSGVGRSDLAASPTGHARSGHQLFDPDAFARVARQDLVEPPRHSLTRRRGMVEVNGPPCHQRARAGRPHGPMPGCPHTSWVRTAASAGSCRRRRPLALAGCGVRCRR